MDGVYAHGQDLGLRPRAQHPHGRRHVAAAAWWAWFRPTSRPRTSASTSREGESHYKGVSLAVKKQWDGKLQLLGSYTLSESTSNTSLRATDEFGEYDVLDPIHPFADNQENPTRTDNRHRVTISGVWSPGWDLTIAPVFRYKSAQPLQHHLRLRQQPDGLICDLPAGVETLNSGRGASFLQLDLRVSKRFRIGGSRAIELIAEGFNLTNDTNPGSYVANQTAGHVRDADRVRRRLPAWRAAAVPARSALRVLAVR